MSQFIYEAENGDNIYKAIDKLKASLEEGQEYKILLFGDSKITVYKDSEKRDILNIYDLQKRLAFMKNKFNYFDV